MLKRFVLSIDREFQAEAESKEQAIPLLLTQVKRELESIIEEGVAVRSYQHPDGRFRYFPPPPMGYKLLESVLESYRDHKSHIANVPQYTLEFAIRNEVNPPVPDPSAGAWAYVALLPQDTMVWDSDKKDWTNVSEHPNYRSA